MRLPVSQFTEQVSIAREAGWTGLGPQTSEVAHTTAYCEPGFRRVVNNKGEEDTASLFMVLRPGVSIGPGDLVDWNGSTYQVIDAHPLRFAGAVSHTEVYLKGVV